MLSAPGRFPLIPEIAAPSSPLSRPHPSVAQSLTPHHLPARSTGRRPVDLYVSPVPANCVDARLFGQFLERASWHGEYGPECVADPVSGDLPEDVVRLLAAMRIPLIRFPAGTDVDFLDWRDLISNVPGRRGGRRPVSVGHMGGRVTNRFGLHEYFRLRDCLGCETLLVVNLLDALARRRPLEEAALLAAGLVAYANAPVGARLPDGMPDWPALRARNGHTAPFGARYFQLGNEWFMPYYQDAVPKALGTTTPRELAAWYTQCLRVFIERMTAVDPSIELIIDAEMGRGIEATVLADPYIRAKVRFVAIHRYAPCGMDKALRRGHPVPLSKLTPEALWQAWVSMPGAFGPDGQNHAFGGHDLIRFARNHGYRVAATEWNWNGWFTGRAQRPHVPQPLSAAALGVAGFLHGLMRSGHDVDLAVQSMLVGNNWGITAIRVDPTGNQRPYPLPQGIVTTLYNHNHGKVRLHSRLEHLPTYTTDLDFPSTEGPRQPIGLVDALVTSSGPSVYVHAINRSLSEPMELHVHLPAELPAGVGNALQHVQTFPPSEPWGPHSQRPRTLSCPVPAEGPLRLLLPPASVSVAEVPLHASAAHATRGTEDAGASATVTV